MLNIHNVASGVGAYTGYLRLVVSPQQVSIFYCEVFHGTNFQVNLNNLTSPVSVRWQTGGVTKLPWL